MTSFDALPFFFARRAFQSKLPTRVADLLAVGLGLDFRVNGK